SHSHAPTAPHPLSLHDALPIYSDPMSSTQLLTIGETMALVTPTTPTSLQTAEVFAVDVAGAESNVASHCAHLGISAAWVSALGDDPSAGGSSPISRAAG